DHPHSDLTCQDFRSRDLFWDQCRNLLEFFEKNQIPITETENHDDLVQEGDYCLAIPGKMYIIFLRTGQGSIDLSNANGNFSVKWFDPKNGGPLKSGTTKKIKGGKIQQLKAISSEQDKDWVVILKADD
ncbi:MAG: putative collagen-binding domain-containing protein, partial [Bacteroidales bacterium]